MAKLIICIFFFTMTTNLFSQIEDKKSVDDWIDFASPSFNSFFIGFEIAELIQRDFTDLGINNFTIHGGQRFHSKLPFYFGWSMLSYHVNLSDKHIQDTSQVYFIEGDRKKLTGETGAINLWFDTSFNFLSFFRIKDRYAIRIIPEIGIGLGYGLWGFQHTDTNEIYRLQALTLLARFNLRTTIFDFLYIDYPLWNFFIYLAKSRSVYGNLSGIEINRPEVFGMTALISVGFIFKY